MKQNTFPLHEANSVSLYEAKLSLFKWSKIVSLHEENRLFTWSKILYLLDAEFIQTNFKVILRGTWKLAIKTNQNMSCAMWVDNILNSYDTFWILVLFVSMLSDFWFNSVKRD